ncbi:response regulator [Paenibacillus sp. SYP-B3998]|uniref:Response regulator n=1 Tax=Paenibacillus sp. SYP-B3998 TaxID=2678564 RepID=A0A6G4A1T0_9BACL|nr:response regulator transcription factor family protein [Paenibacillus sp. SYP-B3998]NEW07894.1 response regulator [Paenibacillus sp. SYP-B3998]
MPLFLKQWPWQDYTFLAVRTLWVIAIVLLSYQDHPVFSFPVILIGALLCHTLPLVLRRFRYTWYVIAELLLAGGLSLFLAHHYELIRLFLPAVLSISFYSRGKRHLFMVPAAVTLFTFGGRGVHHLSVEFVLQNIVDATFVYLVGFGLQKISDSVDAIKQKLKLAKEQYSILEQYSNQVERMTLLEERYRMARELHDTIGYTFTSVILGMETMRPYIPSKEGGDKLQSILKSARNGLEEIRKQVHLIDPLEEDLSLDLSLLGIINEFKANTAVRVVFRTMGEPFPVMKHTKLALHRCLQEGLTNASRHGQATSIQVLLHHEKDKISMQVQDNGVGREDLQFGFGLSGMRERLTSLQGQLYVHSRDGEGTIITCTIPYRQEEPQVDKIHILLVDDQLMLRGSLQSLLEEEPDFHVRTADHGKQAIEACESEQPDIILMDIHMPEMDGLTATKWIKEMWPDIRIIMVTSFEDVAYASKSLSLGAEGYVLKTTEPKELAATIRLVCHGDTMVSREVAKKLFQSDSEQAARIPYGLTDRELDILRCLSEGLRYKGIASKLYLSEGTIRNYMSSIYLKMQVRDRDEAVEKARNESLLVL